MTSDDDEKSVVDQALDAFVYAPLGILLEVRDLLPKMADRGRGQVALTRLAGKVAAQRGRAEAERLSGSNDPSADKAAKKSRALPIDDYDDLAAPKILPQLDSLSEEELEGLLTYEQAHRGRATIINRIKQLQG